jgi:hypothetical protein
MTDPVLQKQPAHSQTGAQGEENLPRIWNQLTPQVRRQLAQQLARMIQRLRDTAGQEQHRDERG